MRALLTRRIAFAVPTALAASLVMFVLLMVGPNPLDQLQQAANYDAADVQRISDHYGWNRPWYEQYGGWLSRTAHGDWGESIRTKRPARDMILERLPASLALTGLAMLLAMTLSVPLAVVLARRRETRVDYVVAGATFALMATPTFLLGILLQLGAVSLRDLTGGIVFYTGGGSLHGGAVEALQRYTLPVLVLTAVQLGAWLRFQRGELLRVLGNDYVTAAHAKGLPHRTVLVRHALRNALLPITTLAALDLGNLLGGAVIVESVFGLPGLGRLLLDSVQGRDVVVALDIVVLAALAIVVATVLADLAYGALDPRIREARR